MGFELATFVVIVTDCTGGVVVVIVWRLKVSYTLTIF